MTLNFKEHNLKLYLYLATAAAAAAGLWYVNHLRAENAQYKAANESMAQTIARQQMSESANFAVIAKLSTQLKNNITNYERVNNELTNTAMSLILVSLTLAGCGFTTPPPKCQLPKAPPQLMESLPEMRLIQLTTITKFATSGEL